MAEFKVLLFEAIHEKGLTHLKENGCEVTQAPGFSQDEICDCVEDVDAILARAQGQIDRVVMDRAAGLVVVGRHGIGLDNIDVPAATERGIHVVNTPLAPVEAVAEYVLMGMVSISRRSVSADRAAREGDWGFRNRHHGPELLGKTVGVVGFGRIGRRIAEICALGLGMEVLYTDVLSVAPEEEARLHATKVDLQALLERSDFVSLNVPLTDGTHHLIGADELNRMKPSAYLVNCARGPVVDEPALLEALKSEQIAGAVIDVYENEPVDWDNPLLQLDNVLLSPHCSGHTNESAQNLSMVAADIVRVLRGKRPEFPANDPPSPRRELS